MYAFHVVLPATGHKVLLSLVHLLLSFCIEIFELCGDLERKKNNNKENKIGRHKCDNSDKAKENLLPEEKRIRNKTENVFSFNFFYYYNKTISADLFFYLLSNGVADYSSLWLFKGLIDWAISIDRCCGGLNEARACFSSLSDLSIWLYNLCYRKKRRIRYECVLVVVYIHTMALLVPVKMKATKKKVFFPSFFFVYGPSSIEFPLAFAPAHTYAQSIEVL